MTIMRQTYVLSYEWDDNDAFHFTSDEPFSVPDVGEKIYLDPNNGQGPTRTLFAVKSRLFEVQRGETVDNLGFSIHSTYVQLEQCGPADA